MEKDKKENNNEKYLDENEKISDLEKKELEKFILF